MNKYVVSYDISESPERNETYIKLLRELPKMGGVRKLLNVWELESNLNTKDIFDKIKNIIDSEDNSLMVANLSENPKYYNLKKLD